jgi:hypothetical protein
VGEVKSDKVKQELQNKWSQTSREVEVLNLNIQRKVFLVSNAGILLHLSSRTHAATMLYAISVPIDIMSTSPFRSKMRAIKAANKKKYNFTRLLYNTFNEITVFILRNIQDKALSFLKTRFEKNILRDAAYYLAKPFAIFRTPLVKGARGNLVLQIELKEQMLNVYSKTLTIYITLKFLHIAVREGTLSE